MRILEKIWRNMFWLIIFGLSFLTFGNKVVLAADYEIKNFESEITLNQDYSLTIKEKIETNFLIAKHGIYRVIPYIYNHEGKTIKADLRILKITNGYGKNVPYQVSNYNQSKKIKIGDSEKTLIGQQEYLIEYKVDQVVWDYGNGPEIYWNVTGSEWDTLIEKSKAIVISDFGKIKAIETYEGDGNFSENQAIFDGNEGLTIVVLIDKDNQLKQPGLIKKMTNLIEGNWGYLLAVLPTCLMMWMWFKKGRDKKYLSDNVYTKSEDGKEKNVNPFDRPHLPLVYAPIKNLSPAEIGTIVDQKIDVSDIVSEIIELARLGFLKIKKIETKKILGIKTTEYELTKLNKSNEELNKFQIDLLESIFEKGDQIKISDLKNKFYKKIPTLKTDIYEELEKKGISDGNWGKVYGKWIVKIFILNFLTIILVASLFSNLTGNFGPMVIAFLGIVPTIILAIKMPRRTAWGYSLYRQIEGLKYFLGKGKWREEIMEKNLFLEEMLPIAVSLGVVNQLTKDMKDLGVEPPKYFEGAVINNFSHDLNSFNSSVMTNLTSTPSGNSSWSGGSGFSGGSGGGFGGGGGGSW